MLIQYDTDISAYDCEIVYIREDDTHDLATLYNFNAKLAEVVLANQVGALKLLVGLGSEALRIKDIEKIFTSISKSLNKHNITSAISTTLDVEGYSESEFISFASKIIVKNAYQVQKVYIQNEDVQSLQTFAFNSAKHDTSIQKGEAIANGINLCRSLADAPPNICTPSYLATVAQDMAGEFGLECEVLEEADMQELGMGSLLSVSKGSIEPPKLITLHYRGDGDSKPVVLVGKGVTFDSGGISLKSGAGMDEMKYDMGGAASVLGTMRAIAQIKPTLNLTIVVPAVENMPAGNASKPGDVVQSMSGQTIEILNTDAEGRLILCDALTYAGKFNPAKVINVATLTGAVIIALGKHHSGVMGNNQALIDELIAAGKTANDTLWQLPLEDEFDEMLQSNFADMANIGGREAGSITAGCFLARFTKDYTWAHLDIAGTAWHSGKNKGATGRPVSLFCEYLLRK